MDSKKITEHGTIDFINVSSIEESDRTKFEQLRTMLGVTEIYIKEEC